MVTESGSRPASDAASRTALIIHSVRNGSASWRMKPSAFWPARARALGPYAAIQTGSRPSFTHGICTGCPSTVASRPSARSRMTSMASPSRASVLGLRPATRIAESPRPIPQTVRLPYMSLRVAKVEAVTSQVRVPGLVTIGPTVIRSVCSRMRL
ncbi:hypothetical protein SCYAM73S_02026 [Streptomyces cyaneofuscatus]